MAGVSLIPAFHTKAHHLSATSAPIPCCANLRKPGSLPLPIGSRPPNGRTSTTWKRRKGTTVPRAAIEPEEEIWEEGSGGLAVAELGMTEVEKVKKALVEAFYGTNRGLQASSETRAEIVELITQLEAMNPTPVPTQALPLLNGKWILVYTCLSDIFSLYAMGTLPILKAEEISQTIDAESFTVENSVLFSGPLATTSFTTHAKFEVRSPKRVQRMWRCWDKRLNSAPSESSSHPSKMPRPRSLGPSPEVLLLNSSSRSTEPNPGSSQLSSMKISAYHEVMQVVCLYSSRKEAPYCPQLCDRRGSFTLCSN
ncbi:plastid lipid-associated protein 2, chloroplastic isoform X1 [Amborella trichopoda]|uniref:plastid lipid-associated protein 2, chloroplastic isoform X1 n=1 Tax=Amborella trichopoda TaxID=13333 RepID=UPI0009C0D48D|nr:plastid lipid-associated protein 2, chloroplastic isoform X1 [Amborella trichopoda]|eukprot:XP_020523053.1 plastid lipid-associated protein 2, chloroplastic isoform X1 [Amborella trichopoda]